MSAGINPSSYFANLFFRKECSVLGSCGTAFSVTVFGKCVVLTGIAGRFLRYFLAFCLRATACGVTSMKLSSRKQTQTHINLTALTKIAAHH